jgi:hypothetical protein
MFQELFKRPREIRRHLASPLLDERLQFLSHCAAQGTARSTLRNLASHQLMLIDQLGLSERRRITRTEIEAAAKRCAQCQADLRGMEDAPAYFGASRTRNPFDGGRTIRMITDAQFG